MGAISTLAPEGATTLTIKETWDVALAAWQTAKADYDEAAALHDADWEAAEATGRKPDAELGARVDALATPESETRLALMTTPAPDFGAVILKIKMLWVRDDTPENDEYTEAWHRRYPDAVLADMIRLQTEYAGAWVAAWEKDGGAALVCPDGKLHLSFPTYELSPRYVAPAEHMEQWFADNFVATNAQHYHSTMNARIDALKTVPGGVDMVKAYVATKRSAWL